MKRTSEGQFSYNRQHANKLEKIFGIDNTLCVQMQVNWNQFNWNIDCWKILILAI